MKLYNYQKKIILSTYRNKNIGLFLDMGLGKTIIASRLSLIFNNPKLLIICQKSQIPEWIKHYKDEYDIKVNDLTKSFNFDKDGYYIMNYDIVARRKMNIKNFTLILDESSCIKNSKALRTKAILKLKPLNTILLSGTMINGDFEDCYTQLKMLGYEENKRTFENKFIVYKFNPVIGLNLKVGFKNTDELFQLTRDYGGVFLKTKDVALELPNQIFNDVQIKTTPIYNQFKKKKYVVIDGQEFVGDTLLKELNYLRILAGAYNDEKIKTLLELLEGSDERFIVFYNYNIELKFLIANMKRPISIVNGAIKDLTNYYDYDNSITFIQYSAGARGLNLQKANKTIYFSLPLSSDLYEQSKKRTHRIGQKNVCMYYNLLCGIENNIKKTLDLKKSYNVKLFDYDK